MLDPTTLTTEQRKLIEAYFWSKVDRRADDDCWPWKGSPDDRGNGMACFLGGRVLAHRLSYFLFKGNPGPLFVCHSCDERYSIGDITYRRCCNPDHLWLGTAQDNATDCVTKGRSARGDRNASRLYPERRPRGDTHVLHAHPEKACHGEGSPWAKLTDDSVRAIRSEYADGGVTLQQLADRYGVSFGLIGHVVKRRNWKHVV